LLSNTNDTTQSNINYEILSPLELCNPSLQQSIVSFLYRELGQFRDPEEDIRACLDYIMDTNKGGQVFLARDPEKVIVGAVLLTKTNMDQFVPPYLLVYIATAERMRGKGVGKTLLETVRDTVKAPIALHVEHDNPAKRLYERLGFTSKYAEMRLYP
jgi:[ribosomal protein S18]-alanine N-acetyltransferase